MYSGFRAWGAHLGNSGFRLVAEVGFEGTQGEGFGCWGKGIQDSGAHRL